LDISKDTLPSVDVILCRDCLIHFSLEDIDATIKNFKRSKSKYLLATNHIDVKKNVEIRTGEWRSVNLQLPPFNFPAPLKLIIEDA
jgi:chemotaxis methyl-accepting protein methylase